eukprot:519780_1
MGVFVNHQMILKVFPDLSFENIFRNAYKDFKQECISFLKQDLLEITVNDINVAIRFVWLTGMPIQNRSRMAIYDNELSRHHFVRNFKSNSVTMSCKIRIPRYRNDVEIKNRDDNFVLDSDEIHNILLDNDIKIEISQLKLSLNQYKDKNAFIRNIIDGYYQDDTSIDYLPLERQKQKKIYESMLYKYIKLTELNNINLMKIIEKTID